MDVCTHLNWFDRVTAYTSYKGDVYLATRRGDVLTYSNGEKKACQKIKEVAISAIAFSQKGKCIAETDPKILQIWVQDERIISFMLSKYVKRDFLQPEVSGETFCFPCGGIYINGIFPERGCFYATQFQGRVFKKVWGEERVEELFCSEEAITASARFENAFYFGGFAGYCAGLDFRTFKTTHNFCGGDATFTSIGASETWVMGLDQRKCVNLWDVRKPSVLLKSWEEKHPKKISFEGDHFFLDCRDAIHFWHGR